MSINEKQNAVVIDKDSLEYICGLITSIINMPKNIISDNSIADNTSYSSHHIEDKLSNLRNELENYSDTLVANINKLTKDVIFDKSSVTNENVLYLYKAKDDTSNNYMQMMLINGQSIELGTTEIDFSKYLTKEECLDKFAVKLDFTTLQNSFNTLKSSVESHENNNKIHITDDERNSWTNKLDESIFNNFLKDYIPIDVSNTTEEVILSKIKNIADIKKIAVIRLYDADAKIFPVGGNYIGIIVNINGNEITCYFINHWDSKVVFTASIQSSDTKINISKICTTNVKNIPQTTISEIPKNDNVALSTQGVSSWYKVENGICYFCLALNGLSTTGSAIASLSGILPKPKNEIRKTYDQWETTATTPCISLMALLRTSGRLDLYRITKDKLYIIQDSYEVAE